MPTTLLVVQPPLHLGMLSVFSLFHYPSHEKFLSIPFYHISFSILWWEKPLVFLYLSLYHASSGPNRFTTYFRPRCLPSRALPKRGPSWIPKRPFSPLHQTTPFVIPLTMRPPPLHWVDTNWWCSSHSIIVLLLHVFPCNFCCYHWMLSYFILFWNWFHSLVFASLKNNVGLAHLPLLGPWTSQGISFIIYF